MRSAAFRAAGASATCVCVPVEDARSSPATGRVLIQAPDSCATIGPKNRISASLNLGVDPSLLRVFVSSTSEDLKIHRAVARQVISNIRWHAVMMEDFGASPTATVTACVEELEKCELMLLIVAFRRGWVPTIEQGGNATDSITALELASARQRHIPVLALLANDETWPLKYCDDDPAALAWVKRFRSDLNLPAEFFDHEEAGAVEEKRLPGFREQVRKVLLSHQARLLEERAAAVAAPTQGLEYFASARDSILDGSCIPFVGPGVFDEGPLGIAALAGALDEKNTAQGVCLATVAEYFERLRGSRERFLSDLQKLVAKQSRESKFPPALEMLVAMPQRPPLVVATTHDQLMEDALAKAGTTRVATVTHVIRSAGGEHDGKILVFRRDAPPVFSPADRVELDNDEWVIYRPLGSPLLHAHLDPNLEIDTVVITEADHLTFLGRLENQHMQVPTRFSRPLQRLPLLFLGYGLDVWPYRLVMHVFESVGGRSKGAHALAVRQPASDMERLAWKRLGADVVELHSNEFARRVMAPA